MSPSYHSYYENGLLKKELIEGEMGLRFVYNNPIGKLFRRILRRAWVSRLYARYQDSSFSKRKIRTFIKKHAINTRECEKPIDQYRSFNEFFSRKLKPGSRIIDRDSGSLISPADSKLLVIQKLMTETLFLVKNKTFNLEKFLNNKTLAGEYIGGVMMVFRLAPYDYHRFHFPCDCVPSAPVIINGLYESVNPIAYQAGIQALTENERHLITLDTKLFGAILMIPVGAMMVGKIVETYKPNKSYKKGDEVGYFAFGGSTIVLLCKRNVIEPEKDFVIHSSSGYETAVRMGAGVAHGV